MKTTLFNCLIAFGDTLAMIVGFVIIVTVICISVAYALVTT